MEAVGYLYLFALPVLQQIRVEALHALLLVAFFTIGYDSPLHAYFVHHQIEVVLIALTTQVLD